MKEEIEMENRKRIERVNEVGEEDILAARLGLELSRTPRFIAGRDEGWDIVNDHATQT